MYRADNPSRASFSFPFSVDVSFFCFGTSTSKDFDMFCVYFLLNRREIYVLCPVLPDNLSFPLESFNRMKSWIEKSNNQKSQEWINEMLKNSKKEKMDFSIGKRLVEVRLQGMENDVEITKNILEVDLQKEIEKGHIKIFERSDYVLLEVSSSFFFFLTIFHHNMNNTS